jgi:hypothetical protein
MFPSGKLVEFLQTEESLALQTEALIGTLCPGAEDPAICEAVINTHWALIGLAVYPTFLEPNAICGTLGICSRNSLVKEWTCETCIGGIEGAARIVMNLAPEIMDFLKVHSIQHVFLCSEYYVFENNHNQKVNIQ